LSSIGFGVLGSILLLVLTMAMVLAMMSWGGATMPDTPITHAPDQLILSFIWGFAFAAWQEENLFRGYLQPLLIEHLGYWQGIVAQAALFSLAHIGYFTTLLPFGISFVVGIVLGWMRGRDRNLVAPFIAHGFIG